MNREKNKKLQTGQRKVRNVKQKDGIVMPVPVSKTDLPDGYATMPNHGEIVNLCNVPLHKFHGAATWPLPDTPNRLVLAYWWHIGREIVQELQGGDEPAGYGKKVLAGLSAKLQKRYDKSFSVTNLRYFRLFYQTYAERLPEIRHTTCDELFQADINCPMATIGL